MEEATDCSGCLLAECNALTDHGRSYQETSSSLSSQNRLLRALSLSSSEKDYQHRSFNRKGEPADLNLFNFRSDYALKY